MIASREFSPRPGPATHRLRHRKGLALDIVPFGGVERPDRTIAWPPEQSEIFNCFGMREALAASDWVKLPGPVTVRVPSIPALVILKIAAWRDRKYRHRCSSALQRPRRVARRKALGQRRSSGYGRSVPGTTGASGLSTRWQRQRRRTPRGAWSSSTVSTD